MPDDANLMEQLEHEAHIWFAKPESVTDPGRLRRFESLLSDRELRRYRRFHFAEDSHRYLVSHAILRETLSRYAAATPEQWTFRYGEHGRPEIDTPAIADIRFNLTHTNGLVACVVTLGKSCGIDAEKCIARHNPVGVARRMFSESERRMLEACDNERLLDYFYSHWTLREAYVKAIGVGISFPTRKLTFHIGGESGITLTFDDDIDDQGENWMFELLRPTPDHILAVAVRNNPSYTTRIRLYNAIQ